MKNNQYHLIILGLLREGLEGFAGKRWGKVWGIQFLLLTLRTNLRGIYILRREIEKIKLHIMSYGKKHL